MKVHLKNDRSQIGVIAQIYVTEFGQKRLTAQFPYGSVDAAVEEFELV